MLFKNDQSLKVIAENQTDIKSLESKIQFIINLIDGIEDPRQYLLENKTEIQELFEFEQGDGSCIANLLQEIESETLENLKPLTKSRFIDAVIDDWFESETIKLMFSGKLPKDGHASITDFLQFAYNLSQCMKLDDATSITREHEKWSELFDSKDPDTVRGRNACPLVIQGNSLRFAHKNLVEYFIARETFEDVLNFSRSK